MAYDNQLDKGKKPGQDNYTGVGTFAPTPSTNQERNHGVSQNEAFKDAKPKEHSDHYTKPGDFFHPIKK